jgi:hypothetical protein
VEIKMCEFENTELPMKKVELKCPNCQADLMIEKAVINVRSGIQKNILSYDRDNNWFDWEETNFNSDYIDDEEYTCVKCGVDVSEVLKNYI